MKHKVDWPEQRSHSTISPLHFMAMVGWTANHLYWLCTLWLRPKEICFVIKIEIYKFRFTRMAGSSLPTFDPSSCPFHSQNNVGLLDSWHSTLLATCNQCNRRKQKQTLVHRCDSKKKNHTLLSQKSLASVLPIFLHSPFKNCNIFVSSYFELQRVTTTPPLNKKSPDFQKSKEAKLKTKHRWFWHKAMRLSFRKLIPKEDVAINVPPPPLNSPIWRQLTDASYNLLWKPFHSFSSNILSEITSIWISRFIQ